MKLILIVLTLFSSAFFTSYGAAQETLPNVEFRDMRRVQQAEVADALSPLTLLMQDGSIVRLVGIDIPGMHIEDSSVLAVTARDILKDLLVGKRVEIYQTRDKNVGLQNRMGHMLAHIKLAQDDIWVQGVLLKLGLARVKTTAENAHMASEMLALEAAAREDGIGIWAEDGYGILSDDVAEAAIGTFAIVEARVESVALKKNRVYINFGKDWKKDFTVSVAPEDKRKFSKAKMDLLGLGGETIRARGWIREYNGPYMEITHPEAIEIIEISEE